MKLLLVAATLYEVKPLLDFYKITEGANEINQHNVRVLITGVGMVATAFAIGQELAKNSFDLAVNAGIGGAFDREISIGEVLRIERDTMAELGAEDGEKFISISELGFGHSSFQPLSFSAPGPVLALRSANAITVNKVHGSTGTIEKTLIRLNPQVESMEGAAFFYACNAVGLPSLQLRAISNRVERRNREAWDIPLAIKNLNDVLINILKELE